MQDYSIGTASTDGNIKDTFLYIDGNLVAWTDENLGSTAADALLGGITLGASSNHRGGDGARLYFDDFALWSRALDPAEIADLSDRSLDSILNSADFDGDDDVDGADLLIWQRGNGMIGQTDNSNGDANGDGVVDNLDLAKWQNQFGLQFSPLSAAAPVPEANSIAMGIVGTLMIGWFKRATRRSATIKRNAHF